MFTLQNRLTFPQTSDAVSAHERPTPASPRLTVWRGIIVALEIELAAAFSVWLTYRFIHTH